MGSSEKPIFKIGDEYEVIDNSCSHDRSIGSTVKVHGLYTGSLSGFYYTKELNWYISQSDVIKKGSSTDIKSMNIVKKFQLATKSEPEKSFIKAGIAEMNGQLTSDGQEVFLQWLLKENGDAFKTAVVDPILADEEAKDAS